MGSRPLGLLVAAGALAACGRAAPPERASPSEPAAPAATVRGLADGDTEFITPAVSGATTVRLVNIDAPEMRGDTQEPFASAARDALRALTPNGTPVTVQTDREERDSFGRLLGRVARASDGLDVNREQLRAGAAVLYVIWPNTSRFEEYRAAQQEARRARRGIWAPPGLRELPFEYRLRVDGGRPSRPVGDYFTGYYVPAAEYARVNVNNRVFFASESQARGAGYRPCPRVLDGFSGACFARGD